jgi:predicted aminopeptidase
MLNGSETQLAGTIFHELAHARLYVKGDTAFNESYAAFVQRAGVRTWLTSNGNEEKLQDWVAVRQAVQQFNDLLSTTRGRLGELYRSAVPEAEMRDKKAAIFTDLKNQYIALKDQHWQGRDYFSRWFSADLGNAQLALYQSYEGGVCAFSHLFEETDKNIIDFHRRADSLAELDSDQRREWLNESCQPIASGHDL